MLKFARACCCWAGCCRLPLLGTEQVASTDP